MAQLGVAHRSTSSAAFNSAGAPAPSSRPSSLRRQGRLQAHADLRAGRHPGIQEVVAGDLQPDLAEIVEPHTGLVGGRVALRHAHHGAGKGDRLGVATGEDRVQLRAASGSRHPFGQRTGVENGPQHRLALAGVEFEPVEQAAHERGLALVPVVDAFEQQQRQQQPGQLAVGGKQLDGATGPRLVERSSQSERLEHSDLTERAQGRQPVGFLEREPQLRADPPAGDAVQRVAAERLRGQLGGMGLDLETQPGAVAGQAQQAGGVVDEAALVQNPEQPCLEVGEGVVEGDQLAGPLAGQGDRDRVDGEVPAGEVLLGARRPDLRQSARLGIALGASPRDVDPARRPDHRGGLEAVVDGEDGGALVAQLDHPQQLAGEACGLGGDDHVELLRRALQQQVADGPAYEGHVAVALGELRQLLAPGLLVEALEHDRAPAHTGTRTGTPASARVALASATVKRR